MAASETVEFRSLTGGPPRTIRVPGRVLPVLTSYERTALRTGRSVEQIKAESRARTDAVIAEVAARDAAEFSEAVRLGIVPPADPRIVAQTPRADRSWTIVPRGTAPQSAPHDRSQSDTVQPASLTGSQLLFRSALGSIRSAFSSLRGWLRNPTVAGRASAASRRPKAPASVEQKEAV